MVSGPAWATRHHQTHINRLFSSCAFSPFPGSCHFFPHLSTVPRARLIVIATFYSLN